jgi:hypothetical protein
LQCSFTIIVLFVCVCFLHFYRKKTFLQYTIKMDVTLFSFEDTTWVIRRY